MFLERRMRVYARSSQRSSSFSSFSSSSLTLLSSSPSSYVEKTRVYESGVGWDSLRNVNKPRGKRFLARIPRDHIHNWSLLFPLALYFFFLSVLQGSSVRIPCRRKAAEEASRQGSLCDPSTVSFLRNRPLAFHFLKELGPFHAWKLPLCISYRCLRKSQRLRARFT